MRDSEKKENGRWDREESIDKTIDIPSFVNGASSENMEQNFEQKFYEEEPPQEEKKKKTYEKHVPKKVRNKAYIKMAYLFSAMFLALVGYLVYFNVKLIDDVKRNPNNTKGDAQEAYVIRGTIYSSDGEVLAGTNVADDNTETRVYPWRNVFAHVVGYTVNGKSGLEAIYNNDLMTSNASIQDQVGSEKNNEKLRGDSLVLTLDSRLQQAAYNALGAYKGAVVVMEPSTGKILAMVSKPDFDPNDMENQWEILNADDSESPLLNRATQGLYPPGSTFKILTTLEFMREYPNDYRNYTYDCQGSMTQSDVTIKCYDYEVHGFEDLQGSFQHSCNTSFANIGLQLDNDKFAELCKEEMFNGKLPTVLPYSSSQFSLNGNSSVGETMQTAIGQGDTLVSPFHMALIVSAVANDGVLMTPYFVDHIENSDGIEVSETKTMEYKKLMNSDEAQILSSYMQSVVEGGTATSLSGLGYTVAGKTGSAEYEIDGNTGSEANFSTHSWFVGFSNVEDPDIVVSVIAEDGGTGSSAAVPIAREIFNTYYNSVKTY